jgi:all-trans-retinol 13,14-reductase
MKVCVIGGGVGGLSAAYCLSKSGVDISLFEKEDVLGGHCTSYDVQGYTVDTGLHYPFYFSREDLLYEILEDRKNLFVKSVPPVLNRTCREYGLLTNAFKIMAALGLSYYLILEKLGSASLQHALHDMAKRTPLRGERWRETAYAWAYSFWGLDARNVTAEMFFRSILRLESVSFRGLTKSFVDKMSRALSNQQNFIEGYPRGGIVTIADALIEKARKAGAKLLVNTAVSKIKRTNGGFAVYAKGNEYDFDRIVYTAPVETLPSLMELPSEFESRIKRATPWRGLTIWLGIDRPYFKDPRLYFTDRIFPVILPVSVFDISLAPRNRQLIGVASGVAGANVDRDRIVSRALDAVEYSYPNLLEYEVFRHTQFLNISSTKQGILDEKFEYATPIDGLFLAGTNVFEETIGVNWAAYTGKKVADILLSP